MSSQVIEGAASAAAKSAGAADQPVVQVRTENLVKTFQRDREAVHVLRDINLEVKQGELLVLLGPSGCGKTTLLRCLVGLERPGEGRIELGSKTVVDASRRLFVQPNKRDVAMVFQNYALWPHMKVAQNVAYPLKARGLKSDLKSGRVDEVLKVVQCDHLADRYPPELSGGQQQRVALARALAPRPALLLLDEPLSNLDALLRIELRAQLRLLHRELQFTAVHVTHDQEEALALGTRVAVMKAGQFEQIGTPDDVYRRPATEYVADFLGARNRLVMRTDGDGTARIEGGALAGFVRRGFAGAHVLRLRDKDIKVRAVGSTVGDDSIRWLSGGEMVEALPSGDHAEHVIRLGQLRLFANVPAAQGSLSAGQAVEVGLDPARTLCYDSAGQFVQDWAPVA